MTDIEVTRTGSGEETKIELTERSDVPTWAAGAPLAVVGTAPSRLEGREKVTGGAVYTYDVRQPRQCAAWGADHTEDGGTGRLRRLERVHDRPAGAERVGAELRHGVAEPLGADGALGEERRPNAHEALGAP